MLYRIVLALHVVSIISWMAGILYLIRLFVYHAAETENVVMERFKIMESKLYRMITFPAMWASLVFGISMLMLNPMLRKAPWMHGKLLMVAGLMASTLYCGKLLKLFAAGQKPHNERFYRMFNELPTLLMLIIVFLVILKPF